ncbi:MAG: hypothetical protein MR991_00430 [Clostridiales bacterium]|nr:hypothetical protein [Clostridiales bacterium]MCI7618947.1 hypothetical protein [Bacillota bacterium]MDD7036022.1 hypothetical protein [Bacillota bacterium]MDY2920928.1 hypothetical protein [Lentihominibacter sp.]
MKKKAITIFIVVIVALTTIPTLAFATTEVTEVDVDMSIQDSEDGTVASTEVIVIDAGQFENNKSVLNQTINEALSECDHIKIINTSGEAEENVEMYLYGNDKMSVQGNIIYKITSIKKLSNVYGANYLNVSGAPGINIGLSDARTKSYSITFGATYGCPSPNIANAVWGTSSAKTLTYYGTWTVPSKHNGKSVKRGHLHMRPEYSKRQYTVYSRVSGYTDWEKKGTSTTKRAYGVDIYKTFTYK